MFNAQPTGWCKEMARLLLLTKLKSHLSLVYFPTETSVWWRGSKPNCPQNPLRNQSPKLQVSTETRTRAPALATAEKTDMFHLFVEKNQFKTIYTYLHEDPCLWKWSLQCIWKVLVLFRDYCYWKIKFIETFWWLIHIWVCFGRSLYVKTSCTQRTFSGNYVNTHTVLD